MISLKEVFLYEINDGKHKGLLNMVKAILLNPSKKAVLYYRVAKWLYEKKLGAFAIFLRNRLISLYGIHISLNAEIGLGLELKHVNGVVIGDGVKIGENAVIYHQVTLGGQNMGDCEKGNYPDVGDNVTIYSGAKVLGNISIGSNSVIGANSVVLKDVEPDSVYAGVPARRIR
jgi:serine O-acetyltransferase